MSDETITATDNLQRYLEQAKKLKVIRRNGEAVAFNPNKITVAITKAFLDEEGGLTIPASRIHPIAEKLTLDVCMALTRYLHIGGAVHIEDIQDQVELSLGRNDYHKVMRSYILYRDARKKARETIQANLAAHSKQADIFITLQNNSKVPLDRSNLEQIVNDACADLTNVKAQPIIDDTVKNLFDGVNISDVYKTLIMTTRTFVESEPNYGFVAARILQHTIRTEVMRELKLPIPKNQRQMTNYYPQALIASINHGIALNRLDNKLNNFDLEQLGAALKPERDLLFNYLGLQTLYDRYFLHNNSHRYELPQTFFMRVAMGLAINEDKPNERAIEFYNLLSSFDYMSSTPTLFNSGTIRSQLSSCYLSTVPDDLIGIYKAIGDNAQLQKFAGGIGNDWTPVRAMNAIIKGTNGKSQGVIPFLKVVNDTAVAVNQGGKRKGAVCSYLETWHLDIEEFLELRKNTGDERRRTHDMNTANWIPDLFMQRVLDKQDWTLFSPDETPDLHECYGLEFANRYTNYEQLAKDGKIKNYKQIPAVNLWRKMLSMLFETGHPWITFKDACNLRSPQQHAGVIHSSNLCTEITLNTNEDEIAVCNLGSINLAQHVTAKGLDTEKLQKTITTAIRMLDNVIDINYYSVLQARTSNIRHRPIGLGLMGFQDALYKLNISYESEQAVEFADRSMEHISYYAILASTLLAKERGVYSSFEGSLWSKGILPIDSIALLAAARSTDGDQSNNISSNSGGNINDKHLSQDTNQTLDWEHLRSIIKASGMRNSNVIAIAPTATISNICGVSQSIEPTYKNLYVKSNLSGEFTITNTFLVNDLKALNIWDEVMLNDLKYFNGSIQDIDRIPNQIKQKYKTAFEIEPLWLIECASRRQKWIDQSQSLNLYLAKASGKKLDALYKAAWQKGLKTTYYLRSLGATDTEKSTINRSAHNAVEVTSATCAIDDPSCESCQ